MRIGVPRETTADERRVALVPESVARLKKGGVDVRVQRGAGTAAFVTDDAYAAAGAELVDDAAPCSATATSSARCSARPPASRR